MIARSFSLGALALGLIALTVPNWSHGQSASSSDVVRYFDRKNNKEARASGEVQESAAGVKVVAGGKTVTISPADIIAVEYGKLDGMKETPAELRTLETRETAPKLRSIYTEILKKGVNDAKSKRFLEYREVSYAIRVADGKMGDEFKAEAVPTIAKLATFRSTYADSWEVWPISRAAARLQAELGNYSEAASTLATLGKNKNLPNDLKLEARLAEIEVLFRAGDAAANAALADLSKTAGFPATGSLREKLNIYKAAAEAAQSKASGTKPDATVKVIEAIIVNANDSSVKAAGHNALGELYVMFNLPRDAMWEFLWVETVHNQDREELIKAVARLAAVFDLVGDKEHAEIYRKKLPQVKGA